MGTSKSRGSIQPGAGMKELVRDPGAWLDDQHEAMVVISTSGHGLPNFTLAVEVSLCYL